MKEKSLNETCYVRSQLLSIFIFPFILFFFLMGTDRIRYFSPFMFPLLIILAYGFCGFDPKKAAGKLAFIVLTAFIVSTNLVDLSDSFLQPTDERWKQAASLIKKVAHYRRDNKDVLVFQTRYNPSVFAYYYWGPDTAGHFIPQISTKAGYDEVLAGMGAAEKITVVKAMPGKLFFERLAGFPDDSRFWVFRYHDPRFLPIFRKENKGRYILKFIRLNRAFPPVDLFLLERIRAHETKSDS